MSTTGPRIVSVNTGRIAEVEWDAAGRTAIDKRPVPGRVRVGELGLEGDEIADTRHHGGVHQAVYAYAQEDLAFWETELGEPVEPGTFGENLTTAGIDLNALEVGAHLRVVPADGEPEDGALLEVAGVRTPCNDFKAWMGVSGYRTRGFVKRFTEVGRPGPYFRVLETGTVAAGDGLEVVHAPGHGVSVHQIFVALHTDRSQLLSLREVAGLPPKVQQKVDRFVLETGTLLPPSPGVI